jgi:predicted metal-dependent hydrolase
MSNDDNMDDNGVDDDKNRSMHVDDNLRRVYNDILEEDVPERFKELLSRLKEQEDANAGSAPTTAKSEDADE